MGRQVGKKLAREREDSLFDASFSAVGRGMLGICFQYYSTLKTSEDFEAIGARNALDSI